MSLKVLFKQGTNRSKARKKRKERNDKGGKGKGIAMTLDSEKKGKFPPCKFCSKTNHLEKYCWFKGKSPIQCHFYKKLGHIERHCMQK